MSTASRSASRRGRIRTSHASWCRSMPRRASRRRGTAWSAILARYHEEQVWPDKIRSVATYGQLAVLAIVLAEPWKRCRLMQAFERRVLETEAANLDASKGMEALRGRLEKQGGGFCAACGVRPPYWNPLLLYCRKRGWRRWWWSLLVSPLHGRMRG